MFLTLVDQIRWDWLVSCFHFIGQAVRFETCKWKFVKKIMQGTKESQFFDPPKLGTPPKLEALTLPNFILIKHKSAEIQGREVNKELWRKKMGITSLWPWPLTQGHQCQ